MIAGTPDSVIPKLRKILDVLRPGIFSFWLDGPVSAKERKRCLELLNRDVIPALREHGKNLGAGLPVRTGAGFATIGTRWGLCGGLQSGGVGGRVKRAHTAGDDLHPLKASFASTTLRRRGNMKAGNIGGVREKRAVSVDKAGGVAHRCAGDCRRAIWLVLAGGRARGRYC